MERDALTNMVFHSLPLPLALPTPCQYLQAVNVVVIEYEALAPHPQQPEHRPLERLLDHAAVSGLICAMEAHQHLWQRGLQTGAVPGLTHITQQSAEPNSGKKIEEGKGKQHMATHRGWTDRQTHTKARTLLGSLATLSHTQRDDLGNSQHGKQSCQRELSTGKRCSHSTAHSTVIAQLA